MENKEKHNNVFLCECINVNYHLKYTEALYISMFSQKLCEYKETACNGGFYGKLFHFYCDCFFHPLYSSSHINQICKLIVNPVFNACGRAGF